MKLKKIISGGQTGADKTGLVEAKKLGIATGGTAPKGYRTEVGPDYSLRDDYGLVESPFATYPPRTRQNVQDADCTVWFGNIGSPGYTCTKNAAEHKPFYIITKPEQFVELCQRYEVINVAGNRAGTNPQVVSQVEAAFKALGGLLGVLIMDEPKQLTEGFASMSEMRRVRSQLTARDSFQLAEKLGELLKTNPESPLIPVIKDILHDRIESGSHKL